MTILYKFEYMKIHLSFLNLDFWGEIIQTGNCQNTNKAMRGVLVERLHICTHLQVKVISESIHLIKLLLYYKQAKADVHC